MLCCPFLFSRKRIKVSPTVEKEENVIAAERDTENPEPCEATVATTSETSVVSKGVAWADPDNRDVSIELTPAASTNQRGRWKRIRKQLLRCSSCFCWRKRTKVSPIVEEEENVSAAERDTENPEPCETTVATTSETTVVSKRVAWADQGNRDVSIELTPAASVNQRGRWKRIRKQLLRCSSCFSWRKRTKVSPIVHEEENVIAAERDTENPEPCEATVATTSETTVVSKGVAWADPDNRDVSIELTPAASVDQDTENPEPCKATVATTSEGEGEEAQTEGDRMKFVQSRVRELQLANRGLMNFRHSCYVNATLQCLFNAESFCTQLSNQLSNQLSDWIPAPEADLISCFLQLWWKRMSEDREEKRFLLRQFIRAAAARDPVFTEDTQNDAPEFLFHCLGEMMDIGQMFRLLGRSYECPVRAHFTFQIVHVITCGLCGTQNRRMMDVNHLALALPRRGSVRDCLELYFREEEIECMCNVCMHHSAGCKYVFRTLPRILILQLERSRVSAASIQKLHNKIKIDPKLQLSLPEQSCPQEAIQDPHMQEATPFQSVHTDTPPNGQQNPEGRRTERNELGDAVFSYSLISVLNNIGSKMQFGHYISDCYSQSASCWLSCDDEHVTLTTEKRVLKQRGRTAYLLFYERN